MIDQQLSLKELAEHFGLKLRRLHHLHYRRNDGPKPVASRINSSGGKGTPLYSLIEFKAYLQELGLIPRILRGDTITFMESAKLLGLTPSRTKELLRLDPKFPKTLTDKKFHRSLAHLVFVRSEMVEYKASRRKKRDIKTAIVKPIVLSGTLSADIRQFMASPSSLRPRMASSGGKTITVRTEGDWW